MHSTRGARVAGGQQECSFQGRNGLVDPTDLVQSNTGRRGDDPAQYFTGISRTRTRQLVLGTMEDTRPPQPEHKYILAEVFSR